MRCMAELVANAQERGFVGVAIGRFRQEIAARSGQAGRRGLAQHGRSPVLNGDVDHLC